MTATCTLALLTGCATVGAPHAGLSADELAAVRHHDTEGLWAATGLPPDHRPADPHVTVLSREDWAAAYVKCMNNAGFDNYQLRSGGGISVTVVEEQSALERLSVYLCSMSFEIADEYDDTPNGQQLDYLFDYYRESLVPCMATHGYAVVTVPTHSEFVDLVGNWHPYLAMHDDEQQRLFADPAMLAQCPPAPPGIDGDWYYSLFGVTTAE